MGTYTPDASMQVAYGDTIIAEKDWSEWFAYKLVAMLRQKPDDARSAIVARLQQIAAEPAEAQAVDWWAYVDQQWLGYLEGKYEDNIPLSQVSRITVPAASYETVVGWDIPDQWRGLIQRETSVAPQ
jgi:hypothetical protein